MLEFLVKQVVQALHEDAQQRLVMSRMPFHDGCSCVVLACVERCRLGS
jgi:hypothetical protein